MLLHQMVVATAFFNGKLVEELYMKQTEGYMKPGRDHLVYKLKKSLYGLKQCSRCWNKAFGEYLEKIGFTQASGDHWVYVRKGDTLTIIAVHEDDLMILTGTTTEMTRVKASL